MENLQEKQTQQLELVKKAANERFSVVKSEVDELKKRCESLTITDETTLSLANQTLSEVKDLTKKVEEKRKEIKAPYYKAGVAIDEIANKLLGPLDEAIEIGKQKLREWNQQVEAKNQKKLDFLNGLKRQLDEKIPACKTPEALRKLGESVQSMWPAPEKFGIYAQASEETKISLLQLIESKAVAMESGTETNETTLVLEEEIKAEIPVVSTSSGKSATRKTWKYEIQDEKLVQRNFLSVDEAKVKEYLKNNKDGYEADGKKEHLIAGIRFYIDEVPVVK